MPVSWRKIAITFIDPPDQPMRPQPDTDACQAYIFSVDAYTQRRIHELRDETRGAPASKRPLHATSLSYARRKTHPRSKAGAFTGNQRRAAKHECIPKENPMKLIEVTKAPPTKSSA